MNPISDNGKSDVEPAGSQDLSDLRNIELDQILANPLNPRRYFNEGALDLLRTSISEVGVLVPISVFKSPEDGDKYILLDGERRWRSAKDLGLQSIPANVVSVPSPQENVLRMFNIHAVREDWPLIAVALSLRQVMIDFRETGEKRLSELTGLNRATIRRAKRLLALPAYELALIEDEAAEDRVDQVHREDLYLEIDAAVSVMINEFPELLRSYSRDEIIRQFAIKREEDYLESITEFRDVGRIVKSSKVLGAPRDETLSTLRTLIEDPTVTPAAVLNGKFGAQSAQSLIVSKAQSLSRDLEQLSKDSVLPETVVAQLKELFRRLGEILG